MKDIKYFKHKEHNHFVISDECPNKDFVEITKDEYLNMTKKIKDPTKYHINELNQQIKNLKKEISLTDYKVLKFFEGHISEEEFEPIKQLREKLRVQIRALEKELEQYKD